MPFLGFAPSLTASTVFAANPYLTAPTCRAHIILSHPSEPNQLILTRGEGEPYQRSTKGHLKEDGRSLTGSVKIVGSQYLADDAVCNFVMDYPMMAHFERLLLVQRSSPIPVTVQDKWAKNYHKDFLAAISIGDAKWKTSKPGSLFLVQFSLLELLS